MAWALLPHKFQILFCIKNNQGNTLKYTNYINLFIKIINLGGVKNGPVGWNGLTARALSAVHLSIFLGILHCTLCTTRGRQPTVCITVAPNVYFFLILQVCWIREPASPSLPVYALTATWRHDSWKQTEWGPTDLLGASPPPLLGPTKLSLILQETSRVLEFL